MGTLYKLSLEKGVQIVALNETGFSELRIDADLSCNQVAVGDTIRRVRETSSNKDRPRSKIRYLPNTNL